MEELAKIAEIIQGLGEQGKVAFIWWLVAAKIVPTFTGMLINGVWAGIIYVVLSRCSKALYNITRAKDGR